MTSYGACSSCLCATTSAYVKPGVQCRGLGHCEAYQQLNRSSPFAPCNGHKSYAQAMTHVQQSQASMVTACGLSWLNGIATNKQIATSSKPVACANCNCFTCTCRQKRQIHLFIIRLAISTSSNVLATLDHNGQQMH